MDSNKPNDLPWPLIAAALQNELAPEDVPRFRSWLAESAANQQEYHRFEQLWKEGVADYPRYLEADETRAWGDLQAQLDPGTAPRIGWRQWTIAVAAMLIIATGVALLRSRIRGEHQVQYETAAGERRAIPLPDGTIMELEPQTLVQLENGYNKTGRKLNLLGGEAHFVVSPDPGRPFEVDTKAASIRDIGTSFTVALGKDCVSVFVTEGRVAFVKNETGETKDLAAGSSACLYTGGPQQGKLKATPDFAVLLFQNAPLSEVLSALGQRYKKTILLQDSTLAGKRLTVNLEGETFDVAIKVICASLNLDSRPDGNGYILTGRVTR